MWNYLTIVLLSFLLNTSRIVLANDSDESVENEILHESSESESSIYLNASKSISQYINEEIDPCDDFYKFACGKFAKINEELDDGSNDRYVKQKAINEQLEKHLTSAFDEVTLQPEFKSQDSSAFILAKRFFSSCKDNKTSETEGIQPLLKLIEKYGGWPVAKGHQWNEDNWDLIETIAQMTQDGLNTKAFFSFNTESVYQQESPIYVLTITEPVFDVDKSMLLTNYWRQQQYFEFMVDMAVKFGADKSSARIQMADVIHLERELANKTNSMNDIVLNEIKYPITIQNLQISYPYLDWLKYIRSVMPSDLKIDQNATIYFDFSEYFVHLENVLKRTKKRTIANYAIWRAVFFSTNYLNEDLYRKRMEILAGLVRNDYEKSDRNSSRDDEISSRYDECFDKTEKNMKVAINILFNQLRKPKLTTATDALVDNVRSEFIKMLQEVRWMKIETKNAAIKKAENMTIVVAMNNTNYNNVIEKYYNGLNLESLNHFENVRRVLRFEEVKKHRKLHQSVNEADRIMQFSAKEINAEYDPEQNIVYIQTAFLDYFDADLPYYLNYGAFGKTVGHQIAHAFDNSRHGDRIGWSYDEDEFDVRAACFKEQYDGLGINGEKTLDENIADNAGVKAAYRAYQKYVDQHGPEALLPNLEYTAKQLFWISFAQPECSKDTKSTIEKEIENDAHSPSLQRLNGMVQNMHEFAIDFQCSPGSEMNPNRECEIW